MFVKEVVDNFGYYLQRMEKWRFGEQNIFCHMCFAACAASVAGSGVYSL